MQAYFGKTFFCLLVYFKVAFLLDKLSIVWYIINMNKLSYKEQAQILRCLVEGNSIRGTARICGRSKDTVMKLGVEVGKACLAYQDKYLVNLPCTRIECDEIWSFCYAKNKNVSPEKQGQFGQGDVWTWTAICADTKLVPTWALGTRDGQAAKCFIDDLASRLKNKVQLTTDGHKAYLEPIEEAFGDDIDYARLIKLYGNSEGEKNEKRYSPADCTGTEKKAITGKPDLKLISTSYVERQNLTMRMGNRRFTRLTNAFSKKVDNLMHSVSLHYMYYNFCRIHTSLRVTPAMEAGVTDHVWELEEVAELVTKSYKAKKN